MSPMDTKMNCTDYKEALTAEPGFEDESRHAESCAACRAYSEDLLAIDKKIAAALAIDVPALAMPELPDISTNKVVTLPSGRSWSRPAWFALAATVTLGLFIGIQSVDMGFIGATLGEQVLAHVDHERDALLVSNVPVSDDRLAQVVPQDLATMNHDSGLITYAQSCTINGKSVPHLTIQGKYGPVTILLMPDEKVSEAVSLDGINIKGVILPVGEGSIAIIGDREEQLDGIQDNILESVTWDI